jgi:hypothetical protein
MNKTFPEAETTEVLSTSDNLSYVPDNAYPPDENVTDNAYPAHENLSSLTECNSENYLPSTVRVLKPMSLLNIGEEVVSLYKSHGMILIKSMTIINLPAIVMSLGTIGLALGSELTLVSTQVFVAGGILLTLGGMPFQILAMIAAPAVIAKIVSDSFLMKEVDLWESLDFVWQKFGTVASAIICSWVAIAGAYVAITALLMAIIVMIIAASIVVPMVAANFGSTAILLAKLGTGIGAIVTSLILMLASFIGFGATYAMVFLSPIVALIEDKSWFDAPKRSLELVCKSKWATLRFLGILFAVWFSIGIASMIILGPIMLAAQVIAATTGMMSIVHVTQTLVGLLSALTFFPLGSAATALLYYDHRIRYENFSLDELAKSETVKINENS